jgi:hypothetical protein
MLIEKEYLEQDSKEKDFFTLFSLICSINLIGFIRMIFKNSRFLFVAMYHLYSLLNMVTSKSQLKSTSTSSEKRFLFRIGRFQKKIHKSVSRIESS